MRRIVKQLDLGAANLSELLPAEIALHEMQIMVPRHQHERAGEPVGECGNVAGSEEGGKAMVEELPDDAIFDLHRFPWAGGESLLVAIAGDTYEHYPEHLRNIQRWRAARSMQGAAR